MRTAEERRAAVETYVRAAQALVACTHRPELPLIWEYLTRSGALACPDTAPPSQFAVHYAGWLFPFRGERGPRRLGVTALYPDDTGCGGELWDGLAQSKNWALYARFAHLIVVKPDHLDTPPMLGAIFLHEAGHAARGLREDLAPWSGPEAIMREERDMYVLQGELWREAGGLPYAEALAAAGESIRATLTQERCRAGERLIGLPAYDERLDRAFGSAPTEDARGQRKVLFDLFANLEVLRLSAPPDLAQWETNVVQAFLKFLEAKFTV